MDKKVIKIGELIRVTDGTKLFKFDSKDIWIDRFLDLDKESHLLVVESVTNKDDKFYKVIYDGVEWYVLSRDVIT
mgnify:FL=1